MDKICQKPFCEEIAISRGKYCENHRTKKRSNAIAEQRLFMEEYNKNVEKERIENDRIIRREQEIEYEETVRADREIIEKEEFAKSLELSIIEFFKEKKKNILPEPLENEKFYNIKIALPSGLKLVRKFGENVVLRNVRDYIDVHFYENKIKIQNYDLILNYPNKRLTIQDSNTSLESLNVPKSFILHIYDLDS